MSSQQIFGDGKILPISIRDEMRRSYIDYAMSVIVGRALPDVRDGLKPVHRRILYAMHEMGLSPDKAFKKCAKVVGEVLGKYHPHGDTAVYDALVRLAQDFSSRYPLVNGHGNFGSIEGDNAAAMRYTECKLTHVATTMLEDIEQDTVDFVPNYDGSEEEPSVLPCRLPMLLLNGSSGIAVGMATNIPPFNMTEVVDGLVALIDQPQLTPDDMMQYIKGPDFPTGASIIGYSGIREAFRTGRGSVVMRAVASIEQIPGGGGRQERTAIVVTETPFQVNISNLIEKMADLVRDKKLEGISDLRNESDREGMRLVIELKRDAKPDVVLRNLYKHTQLQTTFGVNMLALVKNQPRLLNIVDVLSEFIEHRVEVIVRRTQFLLNKAEARAHILAGLMIAIGDMDNIIKLIRSANSTEEAREKLTTNYSLDELQANAILEMQLRRLTGLEREKINAEHSDLMVKIAEYNEILANRGRVLEIIKVELLEAKEKYGDVRKTSIQPDENDEFSIEDLTPNDAMAVFITKQGYIKRIALDTFQRQSRATRGKGAIKTRDEDDVTHFFTAGMHSKVLFFTSKGRAYGLKVYDLPEGGRTAKGLAIINLLALEQDETVTAVLPVTDFSSGHFLIMLTKQGWIKKIELTNFDSIRRNGIIAIGLEDNDYLGWVMATTDQDDLLIGTSLGMAIRFPVKDLRPLGRTARGVTAMKMRAGDEIVDFSTLPNNDHTADVLIITNDGFGKRTNVAEFRSQNRGGIGLISTKFKNAKSRVTNTCIVTENDELMVVSANGVVVRLRAGEISRQSRMATGVRLQNLDENDFVASVTKIVPMDDEEALLGGESATRDAGDAPPSAE
ncbi:DNA gyrase subunit A [Vampirovibrio chlorellavorus]|uniref:DNA gyrase subunit A n=1 Tax=Vampirovibrio chlorellavorus TaxID=758823 RepID=UPI0026ECB425|nr:DNA gyrase subunit A [Vampirovibrio chlorellavorus]